MTMLEHFSPEAARGLPGPDWLVDRRVAAAERLVAVEWPTASEEIWRYSRIGELDLARFRPVPAEQMGEPGDEPAPGGGPIAAEAGERSGLVVVRNGRVVHHALDPAARGEGRARLRHRHLRAEEIATSLGTCSDASPDAFTVLHDAFLAGGAFVKVPRGVVVDKPIVVLHWSEGDGLASFPHTLVVAEDGAEVTVFDRYGSTDTGRRVDRPLRRRSRRAHRGRQRARALPVGAGARPPHLADRAATRRTSVATRR